MVFLRKYVFKFLTLSALPFLSSFAKPDLSAKAAVLMNRETGAVLYEKNAHMPLYPASITKMITALYALEKKGDALEEPVKASFDAVCAVHPHVKRRSQAHPPYRLEFGGTHMGIKAGEVLSFRTLLYGLLLVSGNDAANVIAEYVSGSIPQFMNELNLYVQSKGCLHTQLYAPHGLSHDDHKTTAYDMALLAREALKNRMLRQIVSTTSYIRPATNLQPEAVMHQHNALVNPQSKFYYPKAIGIKTGFTNAAGYTLVAAAEDGNRKLIAVLLGCQRLDERYKEAIALFEAGFQEKKVQRTLFAKEFDTFTRAVKGGKNLLKAGLHTDAVIDYYESEKQTFSSHVVWQVDALPIIEGQRVGHVQIVSDRGESIAEVPLFAQACVAPTLGYILQKGLNQYLCWILALIGCAVVFSSYCIFHRKR